MFRLIPDSKLWKRQQFVQFCFFWAILATLFLRLNHRFSIGFRSGLLPGQSKTANSLSWIYDLTILDLWHGAESSWNIFACNFVMFEARFELRTSIYFCPFIIPSIGSSDPTPLQLKHTQNIWLRGNLTEFLTKFGVNDDCQGNLRILFCTLFRLMQIIVSSENRTFSQKSNGFPAYFLHHSKRFAFILLVRKGFFQWDIPP